MKRFALLLVFAWFAALAWAGGFVGARVWIRHHPAEGTAGRYFMLRKDSGHAAALVEASSPAYAIARLQGTLEQGEVAFRPRATL